ncbi:MAG: molybdate ABC transporter substrate-binding protein [Myxococcales bacterium]|nr:molybdate ABC transporter substrate-binding protein [Myxococcales bacterium]
MARLRHHGRAFALVGLALAAAACSDDSAQRERTLHVFAASSLTNAFAELERRFEAAHEGVDVAVSYAGSQVLRLQIEHGAPADIFASANAQHMRALADAKLVAGDDVFAESELSLIVPRSAGTAALSSFEQLAQATRLVVGVKNVPVGSYTERMLQRAGRALGLPFERAVRQRIVSRESNARIVRAKVELGEADAAIVYRSDAASSRRVRAVAIPSNVNVRAAYHIGVLRRSEHAALARSFYDFVRSAAAREVMRRHGFVVPQR